MVKNEVAIKLGIKNKAFFKCKYYTIKVCSRVHRLISASE